MVEIVIVMGFGSIVWFWAMRELFRKDGAAEGDKTAVKIGNKSHGQAANSAPLTLTYITKEQIMDLTAEQLREIPEYEVDKLPAVMKDMFRRRRNDVLLADKAKSNR